MNEAEKRGLLVQTGKDLLSSGLVARTWGNISARAGARQCLISPSGLDYLQTRPKDIVRLNIDTGKAQGTREPSSEKAVHMAAYRCFPRAEFVIHTHQKYASAVGLTGETSFKISPEEEEQLGGVGFAAYGLPGTKALSDAVEQVLHAGKQTVFMRHHGVLICAADKEEAMRRAYLLEEICRRILQEAGVPGTDPQVPAGCPSLSGEKILAAARRFTGCKDVDFFAAPAILTCAENGLAIPACLDDMAQMVGGRIPVCRSAKSAVRMLKPYNAVLLRGRGVLIRAQDADDLEALKILADKAACAYLYARSRSVDCVLPPRDVWRMHTKYVFSYARKKENMTETGKRRRY